MPVSNTFKAAGGEHEIGKGEIYFLYSFFKHSWIHFPWCDSCFTFEFGFRFTSSSGVNPDSRLVQQRRVIQRWSSITSFCLPPPCKGNASEPRGLQQGGAIRQSPLLLLMHECKKPQVKGHCTWRGHLICSLHCNSLCPEEVCLQEPTDLQPMICSERHCDGDGMENLLMQTWIQPIVSIRSRELSISQNWIYCRVLSFFAPGSEVLIQNIWLPQNSKQCNSTCPWCKNGNLCK